MIRVAVHAIRSAISRYEEESASRPIAIVIDRDMFNALVRECTDASLYKLEFGDNPSALSLPKDPYTDGIIIDGVLIEWRE
jgi:hypothetical protein